MSTPFQDNDHRSGLAPRVFDALSAQVPHLSALIAGQELPAPPDNVDYTGNLPLDLGEMLNNNLNDCTCAAYYHARQVWTANTQAAVVTESDDDVQQLYVETCGYDPNVGSPGPLGIAQHVLTYLVTTGAPIGDGGAARERLIAFVEVDPRNEDDVKRTIADCGVAYIGFALPTNANYDNRNWDYVVDTPMTGKRHAVVLAAYDAGGATAISWGQTYTMTWDFFQQYVDETYALADATWIRANRTTPAGMTIQQLQALMQSIKRVQPGGENPPPEE